MILQSFENFRFYFGELIGCEGMEREERFTVDLPASDNLSSNRELVLLEGGVEDF